VKCVDTRRKDGLTRRRYRDADGVIHRTVEVPLEVWASINGQGRLGDRMQQCLNRKARITLRCEVERRLADGWKPLAIAHELRVSLRTVQRWKAANK
jgi:hypothetical protein